MIYQIPVLESLLKDRSSKAMYIFPTKALAQDQMRALSDMISQIPDLQDTFVNIHILAILFINPNYIQRFPPLMVIRRMNAVHI